MKFRIKNIFRWKIEFLKNFTDEIFEKLDFWKRHNLLHVRTKNERLSTVRTHRINKNVHIFDLFSLAEPIFEIREKKSLELMLLSELKFYFSQFPILLGPWQSEDENLQVNSFLKRILIFNTNYYRVHSWVNPRAFEIDSQSGLYTKIMVDRKPSRRKSALTIKLEISYPCYGNVWPYLLTWIKSILHSYFLVFNSFCGRCVVYFA